MTTTSPTANGLNVTNGLVDESQFSGFNPSHNFSVYPNGLQMLNNSESYNMVDKDDFVSIGIELPGVKKEEINISQKERNNNNDNSVILEIVAERKNHDILKARRYKSAFVVYKNICKVDNIEASFDNGVLILRIEKIKQKEKVIKIV